MSKTIRFLGGPQNQELRAVEDDVTRVVFCELPDPWGKGNPDEPIELIYHIYLEAWENSFYFKYQGTEKRNEKPIDPYSKLFPLIITGENT